METVLKAIADWIKGILTAGIMSNLSGLFDDVNTQVGNIAQQVGTKPSSFEPRVFAMIEALSRNVVLPIAGIILTFIACYELIEIYCMVSLAPIPMATFGNHEQSHMGQNYLKCLFALGFQGFLILICVAIYAVLIQSVAISGDAINSIWNIVGYTVLLCFSLFKTSSVTKSVLGAH